MKRKTSIIILSLLLLALMAQEVNAQVIQYYLIPVDTSVPNYRGPMYLKWRFNPDGLDVPWSCKDHGLNEVAVCAVDAEQAEHDWLAAQAGVYQFPIDINSNPAPAQISELTTLMEADYIPADWLLPSMTWREILRTTLGQFFLQGQLLVLADVTLDDLAPYINAQFSTLPQEWQDATYTAFDNLGYDSGIIKDNWTLRILLKNAADQWGEQPILFGFTTL